MAKKSTKKSAKATGLEITPIEPEPKPKRARKSVAQNPALTTGIQDPLGEPADGEARTYLGDESALETSAAADPSVSLNAPAEAPAVGVEDAGDSSAGEVDAEEAKESEEETPAEPQRPAKLERLQKILSQAGVASRRRAEELITEGRVQVNGTVVTELGTKADSARDHIRVDGKLLHGAE